MSIVGVTLRFSPEPGYQDQGRFYTSLANVPDLFHYKWGRDVPRETVGKS
jgi:hypothetical protein